MCACDCVYSQQAPSLQTAAESEVPKDGREARKSYTRHSPTSLMEAISPLPAIVAAWGGRVYRRYEDVAQIM